MQYYEIHEISHKTVTIIKQLSIQAFSIHTDFSDHKLHNDTRCLNLKGHSGCKKGLRNLKYIRTSTNLHAIKKTATTEQSLK